MTLIDSGGTNAVREEIMATLRAQIRERQTRGADYDALREWIDRQEAEGSITEEEGAIARLTARHYTAPEVLAYMSGFGTPIGA